MFFGDFGLISYDLNGKERWRLPLGPLTTPMATAHRPSSSMILSSSYAIRRQQLFLIAADKTTGRVRWNRAAGCDPLLFNSRRPQV